MRGQHAKSAGIDSKHHRVVPEARVTGRPRLVVVRPGGRVEIPDSAAFVLVTIALACTLLLPAALHLS
jgi:hypothetical protein